MKENLVCSNCHSNWDYFGKSWKRKKGKWDYRCGNCGSKLKPTATESNTNIWFNESADILSIAIKNLQKGINYGEFFRREAEADDWFNKNSDTSVKKILSKCLDVKYRKILVLADLHCGCKSGLTPPEWFCNESNKKRREVQEELWNWFLNTLNKEIGYVDAVVVNGDAIDGRGVRSGGTELMTSDLFKQVKIAERCLKEVQADKYYFIQGTDYHVSNDGNDFEILLADKFNGIIKDHLWLNVNGCTFDFKHKVASSSVFQGRVTPLLKEIQWNREWSKDGSAPRADILVRSHVHYHNMVTDNESYIAMTTPALQVADTKFGGRQCSGTVDLGMVLFEVPENYTSVCDVTVSVFKKNLDSMKSKSINI